MAAWTAAPGLVSSPAKATGPAPGWEASSTRRRRLEIVDEGQDGGEPGPAPAVGFQLQRRIGAAEAAAHSDRRRQAGARLAVVEQEGRGFESASAGLGVALQPRQRRL